MLRAFFDWLFNTRYRTNVEEFLHFFDDLKYTAEIHVISNYDCRGNGKVLNKEKTDFVNDLLKQRIINMFPHHSKWKWFNDKHPFAFPHLRKVGKVTPYMALVFDMNPSLILDMEKYRQVYGSDPRKKDFVEILDRVSNFTKLDI